MSQVIGVESGAISETVKGKWKINNAAEILRSGKFDSAGKLEFEVGCSVGLPTKWAVTLHEDSYARICCNFEKLKYPRGCIEMNLSYNIYINKVNNDKSFFIHEEGTRNNIDGLGGFTFQLIRRTELNELPLVDGALTIQFELTLYLNKTVHAKTEEDLKIDYEHLFLKRLSKDLNKCRISDLPNVDGATKIISSDGVEFTVNRGILSVRSTVFQHMFQTQMSESKTGIVRLDDLSSKVVDVVLEYMIAGSLHRSWKDDDVIENLIYAAHKYDLNLLLNFLDNTVGTVCTIKNAKRLAVLAERMGLKKAQTDLFHFIKNNANNLKDLIVLESGEL